GPLSCAGCISQTEPVAPPFPLCNGRKARLEAFYATSRGLIFADLVRIPFVGEKFFCWKYGKSRAAAPASFAAHQKFPSFPVYAF
ncbi:MAG: hypothetical protein C0P61_006500, partial [Bacillota bacterium]